MDKLFQIFKVDEEEARKISSQPPEPHNHDFEELLIGIDGELEHFIDFNTTKTQSPFVSFITKGKTHRLIPKIQDGKCSIWALRFKSEFIPETTFQLYSLYHTQANLQFEKGYCFQRLVTLSEMMYAETKQETTDLSIIRQLLGALFSMIEVERKK